jgi:hypothetical protein
MGRRSRKRSTEPLASRERDEPIVQPAPSGPPAPPPPRTPTYVANKDDAPPPPWGSFPLTELGILTSLILLAVAFFAGGDNRALLTGAGIVVLTLSAGELAVREHLAGYRSHTALIAGATAVFSAYVLRLAFVPVELVPPLAIAIFAGMFYILRREFSRRSGGVGFRT